MALDKIAGQPPFLASLLAVAPVMFAYCSSLNLYTRTRIEDRRRGDGLRVVRIGEAEAPRLRASDEVDSSRVSQGR